jgi:ABC-type polysaccharide/polyol phosphate export permease
LAAYWAIVYPAAALAIYGWLFTVVLHVRGDGLPYLSFAFAGLVPWTFVAAAATAACGSIVQAVPTISSVRFPNEIIPLGAMVANAVEPVIGVALLLAVGVAQGVGLGLTLVALPAVAVVLAVWVAALCVVLGTVTVFVRDVRHGLPLALQLGFILTPVMYPPSLLPVRFEWVARVNPVAVVVEGTRDVVLRHVWPDWPLLVAHAAAGTAVLAFTVAYCRSVELRFAEVA